MGSVRKSLSQPWVATTESACMDCQGECRSTIPAPGPYSSGMHCIGHRGGGEHSLLVPGVLGQERAHTAHPGGHMRSRGRNRGASREGGYKKKKTGGKRVDAGDLLKASRSETLTSKESAGTPPCPSRLNHLTDTWKRERREKSWTWLNYVFSGILLDLPELVWNVELTW